MGKQPLPNRKGGKEHHPTQSQYFRREGNISTLGSFGRFSQHSKEGYFTSQSSFETNRETTIWEVVEYPHCDLYN